MNSLIKSSKLVTLVTNNNVNINRLCTYSTRINRLNSNNNNKIDNNRIDKTIVGGIRTYLSIGDHEKAKNRKKPKLVILGCGWSSFAFLKRINTDDYDVTLVSPRNHFLFTPMLASTSVGTIEFRSIAEPVRNAKDNFDYIQAECNHIDNKNSQIHCISALHGDVPFKLDYDYLIMGVGARNNTFGIKGVEQYSNFLKELSHAREIRQKIIHCFEMASLPDVTPEERRRLLSFVVVGGGPTGVEYSGELNDLILEDISRWFPQVPMNEVKITLLEASDRILSAFDSKLVDKAITTFKTSGIDVRTHSPVKEVSDGFVHLKDGTTIPFGLMVWSTGIGPQKLSEKSTMFEKEERSGRILVDDKLMVKNNPNIYAFGDCAIVQGTHLPATAQVAQQQGFYLADAFNKRIKLSKQLTPSNNQNNINMSGLNQNEKVESQIKPFEFKFFGLLAYIGRKSSLFQTKNILLDGLFAWFVWRGAYLTRLGSLRAKLQVPFDWMRTIIFGRNISNF